MATRVGVLAPITIDFDEELDPASVTDQTIAISFVDEANRLRVRGTVAYDAAARRVTFTPREPLWYGYGYDVDVSGVTDLAGNAAGGAPRRFVTNVNAKTRSVLYTSTSTISYWYTYVLDERGFGNELLEYGIGPDNVWFTADDVVVGRDLRVYSDDGRFLEGRDLTAGPDGVFRTADDVTASLLTIAHDADRLVTGYTSYSGAGPDGAWGTADDTIQSYRSHVIVDGQERSQVAFNHPGSDGTWRTADDRANTWYQFEFDAAGNRTRWIYWQSGADLVPGTADDLTQGHTDYQHDDFGAVTSSLYYGAAGPDAVWFTPDDVAQSATKYTYDGDGSQVSIVYVSASGPDGVWLTADDTVRARAAHVHQNRLRTKSIAFVGPGVDAVWGTADDTSDGYQLMTYDASGQLVTYRSYRSGTDMRPETADDRPSSSSEYDVTH